MAPDAPDTISELAYRMRRQRFFNLLFPTDEEFTEFLLDNGYDDRAAEEVLPRLRAAFSLVFQSLLGRR